MKKVAFLMLAVGCLSCNQNQYSPEGKLRKSTVTGYSEIEKYIASQRANLGKLPHVRYAVCYDVSQSFDKKGDKLSPQALEGCWKNDHSNSIVDIAITFVNSNSDLPVIRFSDTPNMRIPKAPSVDMDDPLSELSNSGTRLNPKKVQQYIEDANKLRTERWAAFCLKFDSIAVNISHSSDVANALKHLQLYIDESKGNKTTNYCMIAGDMLPAPFKNLKGKFNLSGADKVVIVGTDSSRAASILCTRVTVAESISGAIQLLNNPTLK